MAVQEPEAGVGRRIATTRRTRRMTQQDLARAAYVSYGMVRAIERGGRAPSEATLDAIAAALGVDPARLLEDRRRTDSRVQAALPELSAVIATYDLPDDGPVRSPTQLRGAVGAAVSWRLGAQYTRLADHVPALLAELSRALHGAVGRRREEVAALLAAACRAADAMAYKHGAYDLSARLVDLMRWAAEQAADSNLAATAAYVRAEIYLAAGSHAAGLRALQMAIDSAPTGPEAEAVAVLGALHMRAAVLAGRAGRSDAAVRHLREARILGGQVREGIYQGTAFGPKSVHVHEMSVAVSLGGAHAARAVAAADGWRPSEVLPAERRSGFYVELARAQLWTGRREDAFDSLRNARRIAPQHVREHPWARQDVATLRRLARGDRHDLTSFAEWIGAV